MDCVRCKDPIDQDSNFCKKCGKQQDVQNNDILPKESAGQKVVGYVIVAAIVIGLGLLTGVLLRAASP